MAKAPQSPLAQIAQLTTDLANATAQINELNATVTALRALIATLNATHQRQKQEIVDLKAENESLRLHISEFEVAAKTPQKVTTDPEKAALQSENDQLKQEVTSMRRYPNGLVTEVDRRPRGLVKTSRRGRK